MAGGGGGEGLEGTIALASSSSAENSISYLIFLQLLPTRFREEPTYCPCRKQPHVFAIYKWYPFLIAMYRYAGSFISGHDVVHMVQIFPC